MSVRALVLNQGADRKVSGAIETLAEDRLPVGDVIVAIDYSTLNYKDGLAITGDGPVVRRWPMVPGIDLVGMALQLGATFVARSFSGDKDQLVPLIKAGIEHRGAAFIDVISPCVAFNNHAGSTKSFDFVREHIQQNFRVRLGIQMTMIFLHHFFFGRALCSRSCCHGPGEDPLFLVC